MQRDELYSAHAQRFALLRVFQSAGLHRLGIGPAVAGLHEVRKYFRFGLAVHVCVVRYGPIHISTVRREIDRRGRRRKIPLGIPESQKRKTITRRRRQRNPAEDPAVDVDRTVPCSHERLIRRIR